ncbi:MAG TPA: TldD/PmbA family protein [Candidatus Limnocylindrales bacterium]|nr:TldD/PmbA family protein [Candidatus Limnocylindrales bacterium]
MSLFGEKELRRIAEEALRAIPDGDGEARLIGRTISLTRFANAAIHQNLTSTELELKVRVAKGRRVAMASTDRLDAEGIARVARDASDLAGRAPENERFTGLPAPRPIPPAPSAYVERTAAASPMDRAKAADRICRPARERGLTAAGYVATNVQEVAVASSLGTWAYSPETVAEAQAAVIGDSGSAFAQRVHTDLAALDVGAVAEEALAKAIAAQGPRDLAPGTHEVVLEPYAVRDIVSFLGNQLQGLAVEEGRSFVKDRLGQRVTGEVTLVDDPFDAASVPRAFDFEGQPSERVTLIDLGVARAVVYDSQTAARHGVRNTGHALPPNPFQPAAPMHLRLEPGDRTREELIRSVKRGVLVTRFWYTRWVHQLRTIVTGMTRDGTFAIVDGEIAYPVKNFRFTQSYHGALAGTLGMGKELALLTPGEQFGVQASAQRVPVLHLAAFAFTGATQY